MTDKRIQLMSEAKPVTAILTLSIPVVVGMIVQVLYNLVDTFFIGKMGDPAQLAAASISTPVFMMIMAVSSMVGTGAASYVSRCLGANKQEQANKTLAVGTAICVVLSVVMTVLGLLFAEPVVWLLGASTDTFPYTMQYVLVLLAGSFAIICNFALGQLIRAEGSTKLSMFGMLIGTVTNIILDPLLIFTFGMGITGAAVATVLGNFFALLFYLVCYLRKKTLLHFDLHLIAWDKTILWEIFSIGIPATLGQLLVSVALMVCNNIAAGYGDISVAAIGICQKVMTIGTFVFMGFGAGCQPLMGFNYGAKNYQRMFGLVKAGILLTSGIGLALTGIFGLFAPLIVGLFAPNEEVIASGSVILRALMLSLPLMGITQLCTVTMQAMGKAVRALLLTISRQGILYIPLLLLLNKLGGFSGFIYAQAITDFLMLFLSIALLNVTLRAESKHPLSPPSTDDAEPTPE